MNIKRKCGVMRVLRCYRKNRQAQTTLCYVLVIIFTLLFMAYTIKNKSLINALKEYETNMIAVQSSSLSKQSTLLTPRTTNKTTPKTPQRLLVYPRNGTGTTFPIPEDVDLNIFNSFCQTEKPLTAVLPIYSSSDGFTSRAELRNTLGKLAEKLNCKIFFIVGFSVDVNVNERLKAEYVTWKDILLMDKIDTYRDLNNKAVAMVKWLSQYCRHVPFVVHLIDDAFINLEKFLIRLQSIPRRKKQYILGGKMNIPVPRNVSENKNAMSREEYPDDRLPIYAIGFAYAFPAVVSDLLHEAAYRAPYCWIEDVWFTGHVRIAANIPMIPLPLKEWTTNVGYLNNATEMPGFYITHSIDKSLYRKYLLGL